MASFCGHNNANGKRCIYWVGASVAVSPRVSQTAAAMAAAVSESSKPEAGQGGKKSDEQAKAFVDKLKSRLGECYRFF